MTHTHPRWTVALPPATRSLRAAQARKFAVQRHGEQTYGAGVPYAHHLDEVHALTVMFRLPEDYQVAAFLHDVLEDTTTTAEELDRAFGPEVTRLVQAVTGVGANRAERTADTLDKLARVPEAIPLKMCDRYANARACVLNGKSRLLEAYRKEWPLYAPLFNQAAERVAVLYRLLADVCEGARGYYAGDRVQLLVASPDLRQPIEAGDPGVVMGVRTYPVPEVPELWVLFDGQDEGMSMRADELVLVRP